VILNTIQVSQKAFSIWLCHIKQLIFSNFDLSGRRMRRMRASGGKPFEKGLTENFQLG
jgi:hypothetical protein